MGVPPRGAKGGNTQREEFILVARGRVQLPTFALGVRCSMQLSYRATFG
jgi:hypothetical protein